VYTSRVLVSDIFEKKSYIQYKFKNLKNPIDKSREMCTKEIAVSVRDIGGKIR
jgi:hypothetical protein